MIMQTVDTSSESWRHETEVRAVANMPTDEARKRYLEGVARHRGSAAAQRLRVDVWEMVRVAA